MLANVTTLVELLRCLSQQFSLWSFNWVTIDTEFRSPLWTVETVLSIPLYKLKSADNFSCYFGKSQTDREISAIHQQSSLVGVINDCTQLRPTVRTSNYVNHAWARTVTLAVWPVFTLCLCYTAEGQKVIQAWNYGSTCQCGRGSLLFTF